MVGVVQILGTLKIFKQIYIVCKNEEYILSSIVTPPPQFLGGYISVVILYIHTTLY